MNRTVAVVSTVVKKLTVTVVTMVMVLFGFYEKVRNVCLL